MASVALAESPTGPAPEPVVSIKNVTHRYKKVVALDAISLDIPTGIMVGIVGPDGVGKSTLMALVAGSKKMQDGKITVLDGDIAERPAPSQRGPAHRLHAARPGEEPVSRAQRPRQRRFHGAAVRAVGRRAPRPRQGAAAGDGAGPVRRSSRGQAVGRDEAEGGAVRRAGPRSGPADPRRADDRRRSAVAAAVLGADRRHPRRASGHERRDLHRLHGRGATVGLDRRDGRWARAGDRHARRADAAHRHDGPGEVLHRAPARGEARRPQGGRDPAARRRKVGDRDRGARPDACASGPSPPSTT